MKDFYSTNDVEGNNNKFKELSVNKKMMLSDCFDLFEEIFKSHRNETILSIRGLGKYLISEGYRNFIFSAKNREFRFISLQIRPCHLSLLMNQFQGVLKEKRSAHL